LCFLCFQLYVSLFLCFDPFSFEQVVFEGQTRQKKSENKDKNKRKQSETFARPSKGARTGLEKANFTLLGKKQKQKTAKVAKVRIDSNCYLFNSIHRLITNL
jgi:hypothetical protein